MTSQLSVDSEFVARATLHWTKEREVKVTGKKAWPIMPSAAAPLLRVLGLLNADASMPADAVRKLSQINHMVTLLLPHIEDLAERHAVVRVVDAGCGTSALTLIVGWLFRERFKKAVQVVGLDANAAVIATSAKRAEALGLGGSVRFVVGDVGALEWQAIYRAGFPEETSDGSSGPVLRPHLVLALHACDTATDSSAAFGISAEADVIALAPCCHAELAKKWKELIEKGAEASEHPLAPVFSSPNLRRETAAHITDAMRMLLLRSKGYEVTATEFVPSAHTPKNRLLLCVRRGRYLAAARKQYEALRNATGDVGIKLEDLVNDSLRSATADEPAACNAVDSNVVP